MTSSLQFGKLHDLIASSLANYTFILSVTTEDLDGSCAFTLALAVPDVTLIQTLACDDATFASICREAVPPCMVATVPRAVVLTILWFDIPGCIYKPM